MTPEFEPFPAGLLLGALALIFMAQIFSAWLTRERSAWSLLALTGAAGVLHPSFVEACLPALLGGAAAAPPDPRLHGWLTMLTGHAILYLGEGSPRAGETMEARVRRLRLPVVLGFGLVLFALSPWISSRLLGSFVLAFHAGLIFAVTYASAMQRRFAEGMRPAAYLIAALLVLAVGTPLIVWIARQSHLPFDAGLLAAGILVLHLLLLGAATMAEPFERLRARLRALEAEQHAAEEARGQAKFLEDENRRVEDRFLARAAEIAALSQELETVRSLQDATYRRLSALTEEAPDALLTIDGKSLQIIEANARAEEFLGHSRDELRGRPLLRLLPAEHGPTEMNRLLESPSGETLANPVFFERKGGGRAPADVTPVVVRSRDRHYVHFYLRDRGPSEAQRQESQRQRGHLDDLADMPDLLVVAALDNSELILWNALAGVVARLPRPEAVTLGVSGALTRLAGPESAGAITRLCLAAAIGRRPLPEYHRLADGRTWRVSATRLRRSGEEGWLLIAVALPSS